MNFNSHLTEEKIIDYQLGNLDMEETAQIKEHLDTCPTCQSHLENWKDLLLDVQHVENEPSPQMYQRLQQSIANTKGSMKQKKKYWVFPGFATAVCLIMILFTIYDSKEPTYQVMHNDSIKNQEMVTKPQTKRLTIIPVKDFENLHGNVWVNKETNELLIEVSGIHDQADKDYQLWMLDQDNHLESEILFVQNGTAKILYRGENVRNLQMIKASLEPRGGSSEPTGPDTFFVPVNYN
ncbi:anti-sigma factor [Radiobacillus kanasensis]|uniref:anti-sigma factor domain-containing protein n=1 Tax=Radiobacillus kanasensis TaxID=2844358 RepID=UPI001E46C6E6|nr:anti-sigma factor [Radiobacillus kanasensis]UFT98695.1 anti-sigma factor [Radiobacillus kanasensis]